MNLLKRTFQAIAARAGYTVIPTWSLLQYPQATFLARLFDLAKVDLVIDVGANSGQYCSFLRHEVGYRGNVLSFEPIPALAAKLKEGASATWHVENVALGAENGTAELNVMEGDQFSSLRAADDSVVTLFKDKNQVRQRVPVIVRTLDSLACEIEMLAGAKSVYLKLDTQGYDMEVLKGAPELLAKVSALQTELSVRRIYEGAPSYDEAIRFVEGLGFAMSGIFPNSSGHFPLLVEFDGHFIADRFLPASHKVTR
jgi:FkbM family methyltransferase